MAAGEVIGDAVANDSAAGDDYFGVRHHGLFVSRGSRRSSTVARAGGSLGWGESAWDVLAGDTHVSKVFHMLQIQNYLQ